MSNLNEDYYDVASEFLKKLASFTREWAELELSRARSKSELKQILNTLKCITKDGTPCIHGIPPEAQAEKEQLYSMIEKYNEEHQKDPIVFSAQTYKHDIPINGVTHKAGSILLYCNQRDYNLIAEFNKQIFAMKDINIQEVSNERFMNENLNEDAVKISNITSNEMNLLKTRPWAHDSYDEAIKNLSFSFSSVAKLDTTYDVYINSNDSVGENNVLKLYENIALSKAILSGPDGDIKNKQMDYERDLLKHAMNVAKGPRTDKVVYLTSAIDSGRYMTIESGKIKVYETGFSLKNFCGRKTYELSLDDIGMTGKAFSAEALNLIKSFKNPVMLPSLNDCAVHCKTGEVVKECLDAKGNLMTYPALTSDILKEHSPEEKCNFLQNIFEIAKKNIALKGFVLDGRNFTAECEKIITSLDQAKDTVVVFETLKEDIEKLKQEIESLESPEPSEPSEITDDNKKNDTKSLDELKAELETKTKELDDFTQKQNTTTLSYLQSEELTTAEKIRRLIVDNPQCGIDSPGINTHPTKTNFECAVESIMSVDVKETQAIIKETSTIEHDSQRLKINEHFVDNTLADSTIDIVKQKSNTERLEWEYDNFDSFSDIISEEIQDVERGDVIWGKSDNDADGFNHDAIDEEDLDDVERTNI